MSSFTGAVASPPGQGLPTRAFGTYLIRFTAAATGGSMGMFEINLLAGEGPPLHVHAREEEFFRVLSGRFRFWCGEEQVELGEGGCILLPRGVPHCFRALEEGENRLMCIVTPGGFEGFFADVDREEPATPEAMMELAARYGVDFLPPAEARRGAA
jgi:mannose-6-phosphate isomerase-like protein (cupin superfamily)